jgi:hypothetical protein
MFPVRYELNIEMLFRINHCFKRIIQFILSKCVMNFLLMLFCHCILVSEMRFIAYHWKSPISRSRGFRACVPDTGLPFRVWATFILDSPRSFLLSPHQRSAAWGLVTMGTRSHTKEMNGFLVERRKTVIHSPPPHTPHTPDQQKPSKKIIGYGFT